MSKLNIAWTTVEKREDAERLAGEAVEKQLAACAQIDGPITSIYTWQGKTEKTAEFRLMFKFPAETADRLRQWIKQKHPYQIPEWAEVEADAVAPEYLKWAEDSCR